jgi:hypothetical protein
MSKKTQLNFAILDDCNVTYQKDITIVNDDNFENNVLKAIKNILKNAPAQRMGVDYVLKSIDPISVLDELLENKYDVWNRVEKYYVIAFAFNGARFPVYSKGYEPELIEWNNNQNGDIITPLKDVDSDWNVNPVIKAVMNANAHLNT